MRILLLMNALMTTLYGCDDPASTSLNKESATCDQLRCDPGVCALLEGEARCFCPDGYFRDERGACLMGARPEAGSSEAGSSEAGSSEAGSIAHVTPDMGALTDHGPSIVDLYTGGEVVSDIGADDSSLADSSLADSSLADSSLADSTLLDLEVIDLGLVDMSVDLEPDQGSDMSSGSLDMSAPYPIYPCDPNPCLEPGRGVCEVRDGEASCACDPGLMEDPVTIECTRPADVRCEMSHLDGDVYEPDECHLDATIISGGVTQRHSVQPGGDDDWFRLDATPGHVYRFSVARDTLPNAILYLYREDGVRQIFSQSSTYEITHEMPDDGPFYYRVSAYNDRSLGDYSISLEDLGPDDHGDEASVATPLEVDGEPIPGDIETRGDDDWFSAPLSAGRRYRVAVTRGTISNAYLYLYRPDGVRIARSSGSPEEVTYDVDETGDWFVRVRHNSSGRGTYLLTVSDVTE